MKTPSLSELRRHHERESGRLPWWCRWCAVFLVLYLAWLVIGFFVLPSFLKTQAQKRLSSLLQRQVSIEKVRFNPLTFAASFETFSVLDHDSTPFVSWKKLYLNFDTFSFLRRQWRFQEIELDGFSGRAAVSDAGLLNFADLIDRFSPNPGAKSSAQKPWPLFVGRLAVTHAVVNYSDLSHGGFSTQIGPASFALRNFYTGGPRQAPGEFSAATESGESFSWKGSVSLAPLKSSGDFEFGQVALKKYAPYYARFVLFDVLDGRLASSFHYEFSAGSAKPQLRLSDGRVSIAGLKIAKHGQTAPVVNLDKIEASDINLAWPNATTDIGRIAITGGSVTAVRDASGFDLATLFTPAGTPRDVILPDGSAQAVPPPKIKIAGISVHGVSLLLEDHTTPEIARHQFTDISSDLRAISLASPGTPMPFGFRATLVPDGEVHAAGTVTLSPLKAELAVELTSIALANFSPYLEACNGAHVVSGKLNTALYFGAQISPGGALAFSAQGDASIDDFSACDAAQKDEIASWRNLATRGFEYTSNPARLMVAEVSWTEPFFHWFINPDDLPASPSSPAESLGVRFPQAASTAGAPDELFVSVDRIGIEKASFDFTDRTVKPQVHLSFNQLGGHIDGLSSSDLARASLDLKGRIEGVSTFAVSGKFNPLSADPYADLRLNVRSADLSPLAPYFVKFAGCELDRGSLSLEAKCRINRRKLDCTSIATFDGLSLGNPVKSEFAIKAPLKFAAALLRDPNGRIVLEPAFAGSIDNPEVRSGRIIWRVLAGSLEKTAAAPFPYLATLGGGGHGEDLAFQRFAPGHVNSLNDDELKKLDLLATALRERPALCLELVGGVDPASDTPALRESNVDDQMRTLIWNDLKLTDPSITFDQVEVDPQQRKGMIRRLFYKTFPNERPKRTGGGGDDDDGGTVAAQRGNLGAFHRRKESTTPHIAPRTQLPSTDTTEPRPDGTTETTGTITTVRPPTFDEMYARLASLVKIDETALRTLATERANAVKDYLVSQGQIEPGRITVVVFSPKQPVVRGAKVELRLK